MGTLRSQQCEQRSMDGQLLLLGIISSRFTHFVLESISIDVSMILNLNLKQSYIQNKTLIHLLALRLHSVYLSTYYTECSGVSDEFNTYLL